MIRVLTELSPFPRYRPPQELRMLWVIDRFEGDFAVCENDRREMRDLPRSELPPGARDGDVLRHGPQGWTLDIDETRKRRQQAEDLTKDLWA